MNGRRHFFFGGGGECSNGATYKEGANGLYMHQCVHLLDPNFSIFAGVNIKTTFFLVPFIFLTMPISESKITSPLLLSAHNNNDIILLIVNQNKKTCLGFKMDVFTNSLLLPTFI